MTPSPSPFGQRSQPRSQHFQNATKGGNEFVAICCNVTRRINAVQHISMSRLRVNHRRIQYREILYSLPKVISEMVGKPAGLPRRPAARRPPFRKFLLAITLVRHQVKKDVDSERVGSFLRKFVEEVIVLAFALP